MQPYFVLYDYILGRAKQADIKKSIKFDTTVTNVIFNGNEFEITSLNKKIINFLMKILII